ncbi:hypothetical protein ONZ45_g19688 [Pleurotus djamor]|nr:hypothetical protein ONZ45_g19688 [Pleurotus djamor]
MTSANDHALVSQQGGDQYVAPVTDDTGNPFAGVPAHLGSASTFYRAVFGDELPYLTQNYPVGKSPTRHGTSGGDFTVDGTGGLYVFDLDAEAVVYGRCHSVTPIQEWPYFYVVTFSYKPNTSLSTKSFTSDNNEWRTLVQNCYANKPHPYAAVEGPYSMMKAGQLVGAPQQGGGTGMLWQAAFIGQAALQTLTVVSTRQVQTRPGGTFPSCTIF